MPQNAAPLPDFTRWPSFPFEGDLRVKTLSPPVDVEPPRSGEDASECVACSTPDDAYIWVSERWRVRAMDRPTGLPIVLILECRSHLDLGDLTNLLAAELGVMTVRLERAIRALDGVARVHVNRWGDGSAHLHMWFLARPYGRLQLRGTFLSLWDDILPVIPEQQWRENMALVAAWLADFGGEAIAEPAHIQWESPSTISASPMAFAADNSVTNGEPEDSAVTTWRPSNLAEFESSTADVPVGSAPLLPRSRADGVSSPSAVPEGGESDPTPPGPSHVGDGVSPQRAVGTDERAPGGTGNATNVTANPAAGPETEPGQRAPEAETTTPATPGDSENTVDPEAARQSVLGETETPARQ